MADDLEKKIRQIAQDKMDSDIDLEATNEAIEEEKEKFGGKTTSLDSYSQVMADIATTYDQELYAAVINEYTDKANKKLQTKKWKWCISPYLLLYGGLIQWYNEIDWGDDVNIKDFEFDIIEWQQPKESFVDAYTMGSKIFLWIINKKKNAINKEFEKGDVTPAIQWKSNTLDHLIYSRVLYWWKPEEGAKEWVTELIDNFSNITIE